MESFVNEGVFYSFCGAPACAGGVRNRTVSEPVVMMSPDDEPFPPRVLVVPFEPPLEPKMSTLLPSFGFPLCDGTLLAVPGVALL